MYFNIVADVHLLPHWKNIAHIGNCENPKKLTEYMKHFVKKCLCWNTSEMFVANETYFYNLSSQLFGMALRQSTSYSCDAPERPPCEIWPHYEGFMQKKSLSKQRSQQEKNS